MGGLLVEDELVVSKTGSDASVLADGVGAALDTADARLFGFEPGEAFHAMPDEEDGPEGVRFEWLVSSNAWSFADTSLGEACDSCQATTASGRGVWGCGNRVIPQRCK
jgi:hypothetical protein